MPEEHLGPVKEGLLRVDRYAASKARRPVKEGQILLASCWAHVRRDFLGVARSWPEPEDWDGSGAVWAGALAAMLFSVFQTLCLWELNPRPWLQAYLQACAEAGGRAPAELDRFLPWKMSEGQRQEWFWEPGKAGEASS